VEREAAGNVAQDPQITLQENCQERKRFNLVFFVVVVWLFFVCFVLFSYIDMVN